MITTKPEKKNILELQELTDENEEITNLLQQLSDMLFEFWIKEKTKTDEPKQ